MNWEQILKFHHSRIRCKYDGKEKIKIRFDEKIWEGFTNKHYLRPLSLAEEKNDDLIHDSLDEVEEEHPDTIDTMDQDGLNTQLSITKSFDHYLLFKRTFFNMRNFKISDTD